MDKPTFFVRMRQEVIEFVIPGRSESSAFLMWYLENFFRVERNEAIDSVCDNTNDKGIDGIYVDDEDEIIYLFQSKYSPNNDQTQGDNDLRNFIGARQWFLDESAVNGLLNSTASNELKALINALKITEKTNYRVISVFVTNKTFNTHATEYISVTQDFECYDSDSLYEKYTFFADEEIITPPIDLYTTNNSHIAYNLPDGINAKVYSIRAKELMKLEGIQDRTLFYKNVRYGVGNTRVNKSIKDTIQDNTEHKNFFLYHNGITIICGDLIEEPTLEKITISNYAVINGCQSMLSFYENRTSLTNNLMVLVKFIVINTSAQLVKDITYYANNQNSIGIQDLRSNDPVQRSLQEEFNLLFNNTILYKRKKGESITAYTTVIEKDFAAQLIVSIYLKKPHYTHLKQKLFGEEYTNIFSRTINAEKIFLCYLLYNIIESNSTLLTNERLRSYGLAIFFFSFVIAEIMRESTFGQEILNNPCEFVTVNKDITVDSIKKLWGLITPDIDFEIEEYISQQQGFFDYKNVFKNSDFVESMARKIKSAYTRLTRRNINDSFENIYNEIFIQSQTLNININSDLSN